MVLRTSGCYVLCIARGVSCFEQASFLDDRGPMAGSPDKTDRAIGQSRTNAMDTVWLLLLRTLASIIVVNPIRHMVLRIASTPPSMRQIPALNVKRKENTSQLIRRKTACCLRKLIRFLQHREELIRSEICSPPSPRGSSPFRFNQRTAETLILYEFGSLVYIIIKVMVFETSEVCTYLFLRAIFKPVDWKTQRWRR